MTGQERERGEKRGVMMQKCSQSTAWKTGQEDRIKERKAKW